MVLGMVGVMAYQAENLGTRYFAEGCYMTVTI